MLDFTLFAYKQLLETITKLDVSVLTFEQFVQLEKKESPSLILRHDVDAKPQRALEMAKIEMEFGLRGTYYFRETTADEFVVRQIAAMGHEIGYHYNDLVRTKGDYPKAISKFEKNLAYLRQFYPVRTISMHGSPLSSYSNLNLWNEYDIQEFELIAETYLYLRDLAKIDTYYFTETGRSWNGDKYNIRDRIENKSSKQPVILCTSDLIQFLSNISFLEKEPKNCLFMLTLHPQRWIDNLFFLMIDLISQSIKNRIKRFVVKRGGYNEYKKKV